MGHRRLSMTHAWPLRRRVAHAVPALFVAAVLTVVCAAVVSLTLTPTAGASALAASPLASGGGGGEIEGTVTEAASHDPLEGIEVCATPVTGAPLEHCVLSTAGGSYTISALATAEYKVEFSVPYEGEANFAAQYWDDEPSFSQATPVAVTAGDPPTSGIDAEMQAGAHVDGEVSSAATGVPIAGIEVCVESAEGEEESFFRCASTDADGDYTVSTLGLGQYTVKFSVPYGEEANFAPQFYEDKPLRYEATVVEVTSAGETLENIDASMHEGGTITGKMIAAATGAPLVDGEVCAFTEGAFILESEYRCATTDDAGEYALTALATDTYSVVFFPPAGTKYLLQYFDGRSTGEEATPVLVTAGSATSGIDAAMHLAGESPPPAPPPVSPPTTTTVGATPSTAAASGNGVAAFTASKAPDVTVTAVRSRSGAIYVSAHCAARSGGCATASVQLTLVEQLHDGRVTALAATNGGRITKRTVVLGGIELTLGAGQSRTVKVPLNAIARKLLAAHGKLPVRVRVRAAGTSLRTESLTLSEPRSRR